jgi:hypothetical protein
VNELRTVYNIDADISRFIIQTNLQGPGAPGLGLPTLGKQTPAPYSAKRLREVEDVPFKFVGCSLVSNGNDLVQPCTLPYVSVDTRLASEDVRYTDLISNKRLEVHDIHEMWDVIV